MLDRLFRPGAYPDESAAEARSVTFQSLWGSDAYRPTQTKAGVSVTQGNAMHIGVVFASIRLIVDSISTLPVSTYTRRGDSRTPYPEPDWVDRPDPDPSVARSDHFQAVLVSMLLGKAAYIRILRAGSDVIGLRVLDPSRVRVQENKSSGMVEFLVDNKTVVAGEDMIHITELRCPGALDGRSRVDELRETLGISKALDEFAASYFGSGTLSSGIVEYPGELDERQAEKLKDQFERKTRGLRNAHRPNVLSGGAKWVPMTTNPENAQVLESRKFAVQEVGRVFKIQPAMLGIVEPGAASFSSVEQQFILFTSLTLKLYVEKIEEAYSRLLPRGVFLKFNMSGLLRGDTATRYAAYSSGIAAGWLSINDIHRLEDMPPVEGGDVYRVPLANVNLDAANIVELDRKILMAQRLIVAGFEPAAALAALGLPAIAHTGLPSVQLQAPVDDSATDTNEPTDPADDPAEDDTEVTP